MRAGRLDEKSCGTTLLGGSRAVEGTLVGVASTGMAEVRSMAF